mgnify:CR=1 FL=1
MPVKKAAGSTKRKKSRTGSKSAKKADTRIRKTAAEKPPALRGGPKKGESAPIAAEQLSAPTAELVECSHCEGTGKCAKGHPYDKGRHQGLFADFRLTSCFECLDAAGESRNTKKLIVCRICHGTGKVPKS